MVYSLLTAYRFFGTQRIHHLVGAHDVFEGGVEFFVIDPQAHDGLDFFPHQVGQDAVVVSLVGAAGNPHNGFALAFQGVPGRIHVGGLGIVDIQHVADAQNGLQPVFDGLEGRQGLPDHIVADARRLGCQGRRHGVVNIVPSAECKLLQVQVAFFLLVAHHHLLVLDKGAFFQLHAFLLGEREHFGLDDDLVQVVDGDCVVRIKNEAVFLAEVAGDAEFGLHVVFHLVVVTVQVVGRNVGDDGDIGPEIIAVVQLEAADFQDIIIEMFRGYLVGVALADVAAQPHVQACVLQQVVDQGSGRGLAVAAGDADFLRGVVPARKFDLGNDMRTLLLQLAHHRGRAGDAGAFYNLVGVEDEFLGMLSLLEGNLPFAQFVRIFRIDGSLIGQEHVEAFHLCEHGGSHAAFRSSQNYDS